MTCHKIVISISLSLMLSLSNVFAQSTYGDIKHLINQAQYQEALDLTEARLAVNVADIKLQFMKGVILTHLDRYRDAEHIFVRLTTAHPKWPEPFNNLAVIYAAEGKYKAAEKALKSAVNTHPSYAVVHKNLGDIYAEMAHRAYNQALALEASHNIAKEKLTLLNALITVPPEMESIHPAPQPDAIMSTVKHETELVKDSIEQVVDAIKQWADVWSAQDVDRYLASYAPAFIPPNQWSRSEWKTERNQRIRQPRFIKVAVSDIKINAHGKDYAEIEFTQAFESDTYNDKVRKEIFMRKVADKWLITQERTR